MLFGLPSLRIKGFYLAVATLAAQFFLEWCFIRIPWLYNNSVSGAIEVPLAHADGNSDHRPDGDGGDPLSGRARASSSAMTWIASNLVHGRIGRMWMSVRDMDLAAELIGIRLLRAKLLAFAVSSFYCGVAGAMMVFLWYGGAEADVFAIDQSFLVLFMVIIGGLGTLIGSFFGAGADLHFADCAAGDPRGVRLADPSGRRRATDLRDRRRADHRVSGGRAERARAALADR